MQRLLRIRINRYFGIFARILLLGLILYFGIQDFRFQTEALLFLLSVLILIFLGEAYKYITFYRKRPVPLWNIALLFAASAVLILFDQQNLCLVYYFFLLGDVIYATKTNIKAEILNGLLIFHFSVFVMRSLLVAIRSFNPNPVEQILLTILLNAVAYVGILFIISSIRYYKHERDRLLTLNNDLIDYSFQEGKYLITAERSKISQQLHDSIGHSLMAVLMNIRYLKAIKESDPASYSTELDEIEALVKESIQGLRTSVENLKELDDHLNLRGELEQLASRFNRLGVVHIGYQYDDTIDEASNRVKNVLHENIREGVTNSIRHGEADIIEIRLQKVRENIELVMKDNGKGCENVVISNGLNGILERVKSVNGRADFKSGKGKGFEICNSIPWEGQA